MTKIGDTSRPLACLFLWLAGYGKGVGMQLCVGGGGTPFTAFREIEGDIFVEIRGHGKSRHCV